MEQNFPNIHEIVQQSAQKSRDEESPLVTQTFKMPEDLKLNVAKICKANGSNPSEFYRTCAQTLVDDYKS